MCGWTTEGVNNVRDEARPAFRDDAESVSELGCVVDGRTDGRAILGSNQTLPSPTNSERARESACKYEAAGPPTMTTQRIYPQS